MASAEDDSHEVLERSQFAGKNFYEVLGVNSLVRGAEESNKEGDYKGVRSTTAQKASPAHPYSSENNVE